MIWQKRGGGVGWSEVVVGGGEGMRVSVVGGGEAADRAAIGLAPCLRVEVNVQ